ncbi:mechanosensitive ion channel [Betaproteobacteria bacterium PRO7]|jgi:small-conductance mechanosensitive channel|nr:mechanosensitive ion channel [Betaproteobacteria bacterium PRO7]
MKDSPLDELLQALAEGLARPQHFWALVVIVVAVAGGWLVSGLVRRRVEARLAAATMRSGAAIDALRFSIDGFRRLAFPVAALLLLAAGEAVLRFSRVLTRTADARLLRLALTLLAAMALIRLLVYVLRRVFSNLSFIAASERVIALAIWLVVALHVTGALGDVVEWLDATKIPIGASKVSLWVVAMGALSVLVTLLAALWIGSALEARLMRAQQLEPNLRVVASRALKALLLLVAVLLGLSMVGIDLTVLSVFGGALGVGLGLGLQRIASNYVSGFIILLDKSLRIGDLITVDKYTGTVTQINTRYTVIRALDGTEAIVPNEKLVAEPVTNQSYSDRKVLIRSNVQVSYATDVDRALALLQQAARVSPRVLDDPAPGAALVDFGADGLNLALTFWIGDPENGRLNVTSEVNREILRLFRENGIEIPFPQRDVRVVQMPGGVARNA